MKSQTISSNKKNKEKLSVMELVIKNNPSKHYNGALLGLLEPHEIPQINKNK